MAKSKPTASKSSAKTADKSPAPKDEYARKQVSALKKRTAEHRDRLDGAEDAIAKLQAKVSGQSAVIAAQAEVIGMMAQLIGEQAATMETQHRNLALDICGAANDLRDA